MCGTAASGSAHRLLDQVEHRSEVVRWAPHRQAQTRPSYAARGTGQHVHGTSSRSTPRPAGAAGARGWRPRSRRPRRPTLGELRVGAQPAGDLQLGAEPAGGRPAIGPGLAGRASPGRDRAGHVAAIPPRRPRPPRGTATPCPGSGGRSRRGTVRSPPPTAVRWRPRSRSGRSRRGRREDLAATRVELVLAHPGHMLIVTARPPLCNPYVRLGVRHRGLTRRARCTVGSRARAHRRHAVRPADGRGESRPSRCPRDLPGDCRRRRPIRCTAADRRRRRRGRPARDCSCPPTTRRRSTRADAGRGLDLAADSAGGLIGDATARRRCAPPARDTGVVGRGRRRRRPAPPTDRRTCASAGCSTRIRRASFAAYHKQNLLGTGLSAALFTPGERGATLAVDGWRLAPRQSVTTAVSRSTPEPPPVTGRTATSARAAT